MTDLITQVFEQSKKVRTDIVFMSIWEIVNLYKNKELLIDPNFQRLFRWDKKQKTNFIESLLLWIPIPSIFVAESDTGAWELIDWLQRISTILEFMWELRDENLPMLNSNKISSWLLSAEYISNLEWITWSTLPVELQLRIKRSRFSVNVVLNDSDSTAKYEIFNRLNTGWTFLSNQEIRNTLLLQFKPELYNLLDELTENEYFKNVMSLSDKDVEKETDTEFVLRFFCIKNYNESIDWKIYNVSDFLMKKMKKFYEDWVFDIEKERNIFIETFKRLDSELWWKALKRFYEDWRWFYGRVMIPWFDTIAVGVGYNIENKSLSDENLESLLKQLWSNDLFNNSIAVWKSVEQKLTFCEQFWKDFFKK